MRVIGNEEFFKVGLINILKHEKISGGIDELITPFITQSIDWYDLSGRISFSLLGS